MYQGPPYASGIQDPQPFYTPSGAPFVQYVASGNTPFTTVEFGQQYHPQQHQAYNQQQQQLQQQHQQRNQAQRPNNNPTAPPPEYYNKRNRDAMVNSDGAKLASNPVGRNGNDRSRSREGDKSEAVEDERKEEENPERDSKRRKQESFGKTSLVSDKGNLTLVPYLTTAVKFPTEGFHPADVYRIEQFDMQFGSIPGIDTIVQKGLQNRPVDFVLSYYWVWNNDNRLNLDDLYALRSQYDWIVKTEVNVSGNSCDKRFFKSMGLKSLCFCDVCRKGSSEEVYEHFEKKESKSETKQENRTELMPSNMNTYNGNQYGNNVQFMSVSPSGLGTNLVVQTTGAGGNQYHTVPNYPFQNVPGDSPYFQSNQHQYLQNLPPHLTTEQRTFKPPFVPSDDDSLAVHWPRFWVTIKKATAAEKSAFRAK